MAPINTNPMLDEGGSSSAPMSATQLQTQADLLKKISSTLNGGTVSATDKADLAAWNSAYDSIEAQVAQAAAANTATTGGATPAAAPAGTRSVISTFWDKNGNLVYIYSDGSTVTTDINNGSAQAKKDAAKSAWTILKSTFDQYGLGVLADSVKTLIEGGASEAEMLLALRNTEAYKKRFAANDARVKAGLRSLSEAEYIGLEDAYSNLMRRYGLPDWYTQQGELGKQANLEQFIANDVSPAELEDRIQLAVNRVQNGPKEVMQQLTTYFPNITQGDMLAYILDPKKALPVLQRQVQTAEIGAEASRYGLTTGLDRASELAQLGINQAAARAGYQAIGSGLERGRALGSIYGENYDQNTAEQEIFNMNDANAAARKRRKITNLEQAAFGGSSGIAGGALQQNTAGAY